MTLKQLSEILGLSQTTISRALNGYPEVSDATRARVQSVAKQLNYQPNRRAMSLATGKARAIGHVVPETSMHEVVNPIFAEFIAGAGETYKRNNYDLMLSIASRQDEEEIYRSIAKSGTVDGFIIQIPRRSDNRVKLLREIGRPFVIHGRVSETCPSDYSWIDVNNERLFHQSTSLLVDLGHTRIGLINGNEALDFAWSRRKGYLKALADAGLDPDPEIMRASEQTETHGYLSAKAMLAQADPPTAFVATSYIVAIGANRAIYEAGLILGHDISVVIHDDQLSYFDNGGEEPLFTGTRSSVRQAGALAAQMLLDIIANPARAPVNRILEAPLVLGRSTGKCRNPRG